MTTPERRQVLYSKMLRFMRENRVDVVPTDLQTLCKRAGIDLVPLSAIMRDTGMGAEDVFAVWGNADGAVNSYRGRHRIAFNDAAPANRVRFTICEELAHIVYGHTADTDFNMFRQGYTDDKYAQYDEEARLGAGFLVCHPRFFFAYEQYLKPEHLSRLCGISLPCAKARHEIFTKYKSEIVSNITYQFSSVPHAKEHVRRVVGA